jgi:hypothetical protein
VPLHSPVAGAPFGSGMLCERLASTALSFTGPLPIFITWPFRIWKRGILDVQRNVRSSCVRNRPPIAGWSTTWW